MKLNTRIEIDVTDIVVDDGYYSFNYTVIRDGKKKKGSYDSDYDGQTAKQFLKVLENWEAINIVLERLCDGAE